MVSFSKINHRQATQLDMDRNIFLQYLLKIYLIFYNIVKSLLTSGFLANRFFLFIYFIYIYIYIYISFIWPGHRITLSHFHQKADKDNLITSKEFCKATTKFDLGG